MRNTTVGTGTALTPSPCDLADTAAGLVATGNHTGRAYTRCLPMAVALTKETLNVGSLGMRISYDRSCYDSYRYRLPCLSPTYASNGVVTLFFAE